jgi:hypothetical protein
MATAQAGRDPIRSNQQGGAVEKIYTLRAHTHVFYGAERSHIGEAPTRPKSAELVASHIGKLARPGFGI